MLEENVSVRRTVTVTVRQQSCPKTRFRNKFSHQSGESHNFFGVSSENLWFSVPLEFFRKIREKPQIPSATELLQSPTELVQHPGCVQLRGCSGAPCLPIAMSWIIMDPLIRSPRPKYGHDVVFTHVNPINHLRQKPCLWVVSTIPKWFMIGFTTLDTYENIHLSPSITVWGLNRQVVSLAVFLLLLVLATPSDFQHTNRGWGPDSMPAVSAPESVNIS